jgi:sensor histidine kinase YesM
MQQGDTKKATAMLLKVSDLLRISLKEQVEDLVPLFTELTLLQLYLDIQQIRLGERLLVEWSIPSDLQQALVPPMLLQPIVENTFKHGIEPYAKIGIIHLEVNRAGNTLQIAVQDNGMEGAKSSAFSLGIGLTNTLERLEHLFADSFVFSIDKNPDCPGITVRIQIPLLFPPWSKPVPISLFLTSKCPNLTVCSWLDNFPMVVFQ